MGGGSVNQPSSTLTLTAFHKDVRRAIHDLVNTHGVRARQPDGNHIFLYSGTRGERPLKVAASRKPEDSVKFIGQWADKHGFVPQPAQEPVSEAPGAAVAPEPTPEPEAPEEADPRHYVVFKGRTSEWIYADGNGVRCLCGWTGERRGAHLHENKHTGLNANSQPLAVAARSRNIQRRNIRKALTLLAEPHGFLVVEDQSDEVDRLKAQVEELKAKLALVKEAMSL